MCRSRSVNIIYFTFWSIVAITLDTKRFTIEEENLKKEIQEKLNSKIRDVEFDVKLIIVINDAGELFSVWTNTLSVPQNKIVPVFIQFIVQGKDHIQVLSTIYDLYYL